MSAVRGGREAYVSVCDAWISRSAAERLTALILGAVASGKPARGAARDIDAGLRAELGPEWNGDAALIARGIRRVRAKRRADQVLRRFGRPVKQAIPAAIRPPIDAVYHPFARHIAAGASRRRYGGGFVSAIHEDDDLLHYGLEVARAADPAFIYYRAVESYFGGGEWNAVQVLDALVDAGMEIGAGGSFLDFACGYGRVTRHLVHMLDRTKLTVSDVDRQAVDFVTEELGVRGFYSSHTPNELADHGRYDAIAVVSLFSHLPIETWAPWLQRLSEMLNPGGFMLFSTLGAHAWEVNVPEAERSAYEAKEDGFLYSARNETRGRLSPDEYGMAYVSERFVERVIAEGTAGRLVKSCPQALNGLQDVFVLQAM